MGSCFCERAIKLVVFCSQELCLNLMLILVPFYDYFAECEIGVK